MEMKNITYQTRHLYVGIRECVGMKILLFSPCITKSEKPKPIPCPRPCGFDKPCADAAARSATVSLEYAKESVSHVSRTSVRSGVVVLRVSKSVLA